MFEEKQAQIADKSAKEAYWFIISLEQSQNVEGSAHGKFQSERHTFTHLLIILFTKALSVIMPIRENLGFMSLFLT